MKANDKIKIIAKNKKAGHEYHLLENYEAGMVLTGTEVKSLRLGQGKITDSFIRIKAGEAYVYNMHIAPYVHGNRENHESDRIRKLLLHKQEINRLNGKVMQDGLSLIPTKMYFAHGRIKLEFSLAKGKKNYDKRQDELKKASNKRIAYNLKVNNR